MYYLQAICRERHILPLRLVSSKECITHSNSSWLFRNRYCTVHNDMQHLRMLISSLHRFSGSKTIPVPSQRSTSFGTGLMSDAQEYDAAYAATVAAVAYAIAAREEGLGYQENPVSEKFRTPTAGKVASRKKHTSFGEPRATLQSKLADKRGESFKRPTIEGNRSSKWFSGKEPIDHGYDDNEPGANISVRRPLRPPAQKMPEGAMTSDEKVAEKVLNGSAPSIKEPTFAPKWPSRKFEKDQGNQMVPPTAGPRARPVSSYSSRGSRVATESEAFPSEAEAMANAWEKEKMAKIKKQYNEAMETIAEWEAEKKAKARRQKEQKDESDSERKRAKAMEEYNEEISRINKVAAASRLTAEEKRRNAERKVRDKSQTIRSTGKLPRTCGCF
ncbi:hypothetical protein HU200_027144 [Digitaria exilis]|uniref:Remorin C-terminal domain-containing protein n=1 Tax=Digitaria exilis TaxID=1010633 RepID=A0A835EWQ3_9POAL|nr:hypothetical protein HU200_027144 [Digitaria exilis]